MADLFPRLLEAVARRLSSGIMQHSRSVKCSNDKHFTVASRKEGKREKKNSCTRVYHSISMCAVTSCTFAQGSSHRIPLYLSLSLAPFPYPPLSPEISTCISRHIVSERKYLFLHSRLWYDMCVKSQINSAAILSAQ